MLSRFALSAAGACLLASTTFAQTRAQYSPLPSQPKNAGTYHLATGTWSRGIHKSALAGPDVLYDNTCTTGYFIGLSDGDVGLDSGRIPSLSSPATSFSLPGSSDFYVVDGFTIGYCTFQPLVTSVDLSFTDCYSACALPGGALPTPLITLNLVNIPGYNAAGTNGCWIVGFDLANTTLSFTLVGDCNANYDNITSTDSFGWTWTQTIPTTGSSAGPILAGDPSALFNQSCGGIGGGTTFVGASAGPGTGIGLLDQFQIANGPTAPGCYWFGGYGGLGGNPLGGFFLQLEGFGAGGTFSGDAYCFGDGTGATCPCSAFGGIGEGCANSGGSGAVLTGTGVPQFSNDTFGLDVTGVAGVRSGLLVRADNQIATPAGNGILCLTGNSVRSEVHVTDVGGNTTYTVFRQGVSFGSVANVGAPTNFQYWYRDNVVGGCTNSGFTFTNAWTVTYTP